MPGKINADKSNSTPLDIVHSSCTECETFKASTENISKEQLLSRRNNCANCQKEYKYDCVKKLENNFDNRWKKGKSLTFDSRITVQIYKLKKEGYKQKEIASQLNLSEATVSRCLKSKYSERTNNEIQSILDAELDSEIQI